MTTYAGRMTDSPRATEEGEDDSEQLRATAVRRARPGAVDQRAARAGA